MSFKNRNKQIALTLSLGISMLLSFEQMVFAAHFNPFINKTVNVENNKKNDNIKHFESSFSEKKIVTKNRSDDEVSDDFLLDTVLSDHTASAKAPDISSFTQLRTMDGKGGGLSSTAGNFHGASASVDPRTGNASFSLTVASVLYDNGNGRRDLTLSYSGGPSANGRDTFSLGPHWGFNVGTEQASAYEVTGHKTTGMATGDGHAFTMVSDRNNQGEARWRPLHHKLGDVNFTGNPGHWIISKATDTRESIVNGYAQWEQARDGKKLYFYYDRNGAGDSTRRLTYICGHQLTVKEQHRQHNACAGNGIWISYAGRSVTIHGNQEIILHRGESGGISNIDAITMPSLSSDGISNSREKAVIRFAYDEQGKRPWLLSRVSYPTGKSKIFLYNDQSSHPGAQIKGLPVGINGAHIPVVTEVITTSEGSGSTRPLTLREWYRYGETDRYGRAHNYMGYQGAGSVIPGRDNLFDRPDDYTYSVSRDNGLTTTTTTYNKYHLPQLVEQWDNRQNNLLARSEQQYMPLSGTVFSELPGNYSLPIGSSKTLYATTESGGDKAVIPAKVIQAARYDNNGQKLWEQDAYGGVTMTQYCPPEGNERCPVMNSRWPQVAKPEKILMIPATRSPEGSMPFLMMAATEHTDPEPAVITVFDYMSLPAVTAGKKGSASPLKTTALMQTGDNEHFWQVKTKTVGTLPLTAVAYLQPGDALPEPSQGRVSTRTDYRYNTEPYAGNYGQINQIHVVKYKEETPVIKGSALLMAAVPHPAVPLETITLKVQHTIDRSAQTRTTVTTVVSDSSAGQPATNFHGIKNLNAAGGGFSLGTTVYSLNTGEKVASHDTLKEIQTSWHYDHWGRPSRQIITPASGGRAKTKTWQYIFTSQENAVVETLPGGQQFKKVFNAHNQLISTWHRFADQAKESVEDRAAWIPDSEITYTAAGKPESKTVYHADNPGTDDLPGNTIGLTTTYGYDSLNREVWKKAPDGVVSVTVRNDPAMQLLSYKVTNEGLAPLLSVTESNLLGKPVARYLLPLDPVFKQRGKKKNQLLYSQMLQKKLQQVINGLQSFSSLQTQNDYGLLPLSGPGGLFNFVNAALKQRTWLTRTTWEYDGNGRRVAQVQGNGAVTRWVYQQGNLVATIAPDGRIIHDTFNVHGKKVSRCVKPVGSTLCHVLGTRGFDIKGNRIWQADEYGRRLIYTWDANGRMLSMKTPASDDAPAGHTFTYEYNALGMTRALVDGRAYVTHRYDPESWQLTDTNDAISHLHYTYDKNTGALVKITRSAPLKEGGIIPLAGMDYPVTVQTMTQDRYLQPLRVMDEAGNQYTSVHDRLGRVVKTKVRIGTMGKKNKYTLSAAVTLSTTTYDSLSRPATITNGQGIQRLFRYDTAGKLASTTDSLDGRQLLQLSYTYDADTNNILTLTREEGRLAAIQRYTYDLQNNLSAFHCGAAGGGENNNAQADRQSLDLCPRDIDIKGSGLTGPPIITDQKYTFDQWNNISQVVQSVSTKKGTVKKTTDYFYSTHGEEDHLNTYNPNRLLSYHSQWEGQTYSASPALLTYDNAGRIIKDVDGNILHYNAFGQQDKFTNAETKEVTIYTYDSTGHQIAKQPFGSRNRPLQSPLYMLYVGNTMAAKVQRDENNQLHVSAETGGIAHSEDGVITRWYLHNYKGDVLQSVNSQGQLLSNSVYSPYGMQYDRQNHQLAGVPKPLKNQSPWWQSHLPGFDGQVTDEATGYQFLGGGYRAYNPVYRQFMAKDSFSPFKKVNGYGFGDNNPIMNTDPTGHSPKWLGYAMGAMGIGMSIVMAVLLPVAGAAVAGVSGGAAAAAGLALSVGGGVLGTASGSLQIAATKHPENRTLQKASNGFGIAEGIAAMAMGGMAVGEGIKGILDTAGTMAKITSALLITSGVTAAAAGGTGAAASGIGEAMAFDSRLAAKSGLQSAVQYLGYVSMGLMAASMVSGLVATGLSAEVIRQGKKYRPMYILGDNRESISSAGDSEEPYIIPVTYIKDRYEEAAKIFSEKNTNTETVDVPESVLNLQGEKIDNRNLETVFNNLQRNLIDRKDYTGMLGLRMTIIDAVEEAGLFKGLSWEEYGQFTPEFTALAEVFDSSENPVDEVGIISTYLKRYFIRHE